MVSVNFEVQSNQSKPISTLPSIYVPSDRLPSQGVLYPKTATISYRPYTFGEVKKISQSKLSFYDRLNLMLSGIETVNMDKYDLTVSDMYFIAILRKLSTLDKCKFVIEFTCECGNKVKNVKQLEDLEFQDLDVETMQNAKFIFNNIEYRLEPPRVRKFIEMHEYIEQNGLQDEMQLVVFAALFKDYSIQHAHKIIENELPWFVIDELSTIDRGLSHGVKPILCECPACHKMRSVALDEGGEDVILMPFR